MYSGSNFSILLPRKYVLDFNLYVNYMPFVRIFLCVCQHKELPAVVAVFVNYFSPHITLFGSSLILVSL